MVVTKWNEPGSAGRLIAFAGTLGLAAAAAEWRALGALMVALALALLLSRDVLGRVARDRTLRALVVLSVVLGAFFGERDLAIGPVYLSSVGLSLGVQMMARAVAILLAVYTLTTTLSLSTIASVFERIGFKGLGFALGVAVNALPIVQRNLREVFTALRLRGGFRRRPLHALRLVLLATTVNSVRHADDIVAAAEARGFAVERSRRVKLRWQVGDLLLALFVLLSSIAVLVA